MVTSSKAKRSTKKAAKKKPGSNDAVRNFVEIKPIPDGMEEVVKSIVSGCFGKPVEIKRVSADPLSDIVATSLGRIADKLVRTDERIDKLSAAVDALLTRSGVVSAEVPVVQNQNCFAQHPADRDRLGMHVATPMPPQTISMDASIKMLADVASRISDYVDEHRSRYAAVTNQATKSDVNIEQIPPATCELQSVIHSIVHTLLVSHAELREMASRSLV